MYVEKRKECVRPVMKLFKKRKVELEQREYYWDAASEEIWKLLERNTKKEDRICEIGCAGGHFLFHLFRKGYRNLTGIEIRSDEIERTRLQFEQYGIDAELINSDVLSIDQKYDVVFSTGMLQCFSEEDRGKLLEHISKMAPKVIFVVPEIVEKRNVGSSQKVAVDGCTEYCTGNFEWEMSKFFDEVRSGKMSKDILKLKDNFLYYVCTSNSQGKR